MRRSKESWLRTIIFFVVISLTLQVHGKISYESRNGFKDGVPDSAAEAEALLRKLISRPSSSPFNIPSPSSPLLGVYPLDPLTALEIRTAALVIRSANRTSSLQFKCIGLHEPEKALLLPYYLAGTVPPLGRIDRKADVLVVEATSQAVAWVVVNLRTMKIESWTNARPDQHAASVTLDDQDSARTVAFADPRVVQRIKALGFNDLSSVQGDVWDAGYVADNPTYSAVRKLVQIFLYVLLGKGDDYYAHPLDFVVYVDLGAKVVRGIESLPIQQGFSTSNRTGNSIPTAGASIFQPPNSIRNDVRPIAISRPEGTSFQVQDRLVSWQNFQFRVGYNPREGLVINHVTYTDNGKLRPLFYRLSLSEAYIYFGDPRPPYQRKSSYDAGNYEMGKSSMSLSSEFCRGQAYYFDSVTHNDKAETTVVKNSTCIFEEDAGLLWAHYDSASDRMAVTRSQRLSISSFMAIGSCDYFLSWRFYQDATIELSVRLTGLPNTNLMAVDVKAPPYGNLMAPQVYEQNFQYFIGARIDADIDGVQNTVSVEDIVSVPAARNPYGNGIQTQSKVFQTAGDAPTDNAPGRSWRISNPNEVNPVTGRQPSWKLIPQGPNMPSLLAPNSPLKDKRLRWADHNMWVLPFNDEEIFIDGLYLDCGVAKWTNESLSAKIENTDVVLWHVFGFTSTPDPEDWPVVSSLPDTVGFKLRPSNFFTQNPALTVPPASQTTAYDDQKGWSAVPINPTPGWRN